MSKELQKKEIIITTTQPKDTNNLGNGWINGYKNFKDLWIPPEDADFEIIPNQKIEWRDLPEDNEAPTLSRNLLDEAGLWKTKLITTPEGGKTD